MGMKRKRMIGQIILTVLFSVLCIMVIIPFILVLSVSFSNENDIIQYGYKMIPMHIDLASYRYLFKNPESIIRAYEVTILFSVVATFLSVLLMCMLSYTLAKPKIKGKNILSFIIYFTMLFNGGLVPTYILITQYLHLDDTIWVYIIPGLISPWYVFMIRTFFKGIPYDICESAMIDGANEYRIFFGMMIPLSKPVIATVALFMFLGKWNDWMTAMLYINDDRLVSLQYLLQRIMNNIKILQENADASNYMSTEQIPSETVRMAMAIVVAGPALVVFPFFQKYFVKGLTVGSVKG